MNNEEMRQLTDMEARFLGFNDWIEYVEARRAADHQDDYDYERNATCRYDG